MQLFQKMDLRGENELCTFLCGHSKENDKSSTSCLDKHKQSWNGWVLVAQQCPMCYAPVGQFSLRAALIRLFRLAALQTHPAHSLSQTYPCFIFLLCKWLCKEREVGWRECRSWARWKAECTRWFVSDMEMQKLHHSVGKWVTALGKQTVFTGSTIINWATMCFAKWSVAPPLFIHTHHSPIFLC